MTGQAWIWQARATAIETATWRNLQRFGKHSKIKQQKKGKKRERRREKTATRRQRIYHNKYRTIKANLWKPCGWSRRPSTEPAGPRLFSCTQRANESLDFTKVFQSIFACFLLFSFPPPPFAYFTPLTRPRPECCSPLIPIPKLDTPYSVPLPPTMPHLLSTPNPTIREPNPPTLYFITFYWAALERSGNGSGTYRISRAHYIGVLEYANKPKRSSDCSLSDC